MADEGSHKELIQKSEIYKNYYNKQLNKINGDLQNNGELFH